MRDVTAERPDVTSRQSRTDVTGRSDRFKTQVSRNRHRASSERRTIARRPNSMVVPMKTAQATRIHALSEAMRLCEPILSAARWNPATRRIYFRLRDLGRGVIEALHDSRRRAAARLIDQHRISFRTADASTRIHRANDIASQANQVRKTEP